MCAEGVEDVGNHYIVFAQAILESFGRERGSANVFNLLRPRHPHSVQCARDLIPMISTQPL